MDEVGMEEQIDAGWKKTLMNFQCMSNLSKSREEILFR